MTGRLVPLGLVLALFAALAGAPGLFAPALGLVAEPGQTVIYDRQPLWLLAGWHVVLVAAAGAVAAVVGIGLGILVTRPRGAEFMTLARMASNLGQTFPPIAVLAVAVPIVGFGFEPTFIALCAYGLLPVFENTVAGLRGVPATTREAARGMGMPPGAVLARVELPLAAPVILTGFRLSTIINIGTATIGSTVGAVGLGEVIVAGLQSGNTAFVLQGALLVALMAIAVDMALRLPFRSMTRA
ncbi:ABC transporter permease [Limimaricola pyoseonensis]|uniref:Osmoprotectant transport system permease protein n=1 Tax=Limimaricola pyoseonensis TaxID=521013 RepID=A0A1G7KG91_9RHOB|nr:ABC transporter permease [Limimaricola pyoseonensis]SDF35849.1 osmoprotectant transport system permease protein [Limimaricola pyoseonensis]